MIMRDNVKLYLDCTVLALQISKYESVKSYGFTQRPPKGDNVMT